MFGILSNVFGYDLRVDLQVEASDGESARPRQFAVTIKWAATIDVQALVDFARYAALAMTSIPSKITVVKY